MKTLVFIQQRMGSTRLPGKAKAEIYGMDATSHVLSRAYWATGSGSRIYVAYPAMDDFSWFQPRAPFVRSPYAGKENDLVARMKAVLANYRMVNKCDPDVMVRLTGDCPFVPPAAIREAIAAISTHSVDYAQTRSDPSTIPNGIDAQAFRPHVLDDLEPINDHEREHVTPGLMRVARQGYNVAAVEGMLLTSLPYFRITLDTEEDLTSLRAIAEATGGAMNLRSIVSLYETNPELFVT